MLGNVVLVFVFALQDQIQSWWFIGRDKDLSWAGVSVWTRVWMIFNSNC